MSPNALIAKAVLREREKAGLSLSALAAKAGLAKSTLSHLESGNGNPSIETLWAVAAALDVPFSYLFEVAEQDITLIRANEGELIDNEGASASAALLASCPPNSHRDLYRFDLRNGLSRKAEPHPKGTVEHAMVIHGRVRVGPEGKTEVLEQGDYYRYPGDEPHVYESITPEATILLVMQSRACD